MAEQLAFLLPVRQARGRDDFFVSDPNAEALALIDASEGWPAGKLVLVGPEGAGKTHLAHVWVAETGAAIVPAIAAEKAPRDATHVVLEDAHLIAGNRPAEEAVFHLHNNLLGAGGRLLLTARTAPAQWSLTLPDLASRMQATAMVRLGDPNDELLTAVLTKLMHDRQLSPQPNVAAYLVRHMTRSFAETALLVDALDKAALAERRAITLPLARQVLDESGQSGA